MLLQLPEAVKTRDSESEAKTALSDLPQPAHERLVRLLLFKPPDARLDLLRDRVQSTTRRSRSPQYREHNRAGARR
jgi:hypothetical protein